jgi:hypothetical protein
MNNLDQAIIITLGSVALKYRKPYCFPSQNHIRRLLFQHHGIKISRRTLNRHLDTLQLERFFTRIRRLARSETGKLLFNTTLYKLKKKFFNFAGFMKHQGERFAAFFRVPLMAQYRGTSTRGSTGTPPGLSPGSSQTLIEGGREAPASLDPLRANLVRLRELIKSIHKSS